MLNTNKDPTNICETCELLLFFIENKPKMGIIKLAPSNRKMQSQSLNLLQKP